MEVWTHTDRDGDQAYLGETPDGPYLLNTGDGGVYLDRADLLKLYHVIGDEIEQTQETS